MVAMRYLSKRDGIMSKAIKWKGYIKISLHRNHFEALVRSIIAQQISGFAAASITRKLHGLYGGRCPTPEEFLGTNVQKISSAGISPQKLSYIKDLSERIVDGRVELRKFGRLSNEAVITELDGVKGIGRWTAEMFLMFSLGRIDILPKDDYGIRKSIKRLYHLDGLPDRDKLAVFERKWSPYNSVASIYLWEDEGIKEPA